MSSTTRNPWIDTAKGLACVAIVWHHLAFYGPMSDIAQPLAPALMAWLSAHGRMAVQVFLVLGGYLAAASLAPGGTARFASAQQQIGRRFARLIAPYAVALVLAVLAAAAVRPWMGEHPSVPAAPTLPQLLAHALLLQDIVGEEALSAGVWYVAIDFQLFVMAVLLFAAVRHAPAGMAQALVAAGTAASLLVFNRDAGWDHWGPYFWGSYGLGMMACWAVRAPQARRWLLSMALLGAAALAVDFRERIAVALATALLLVAVLRPAGPGGTGLSSLAFGRAHAGLGPLGRISYSVFLIHFPVCLAVNALVSQAWPDSPGANALGMAAAFVLSVAAGRLLYRHVEQPGLPPAWIRALRWQAGLAGAGLAVVFAASRLG